MAAKRPSNIKIYRDGTEKVLAQAICRVKINGFVMPEPVAKSYKEVNKNGSDKSEMRKLWARILYGGLGD